MIDMRRGNSVTGGEMANMKQKKELLRENPQIMAHEDFMENMEIKNPLLLILTDIRIKKIIQQIGC